MKILRHTLNKFRFSINRGHTHRGYHGAMVSPKSRTTPAFVRNSQDKPVTKKRKVGKKMKEGRLGFNQNNGRYGILDGDFWENDGLHCGESLEVMIDDKWVQTRMEMAWEEDGQKWYLVGTPYKGNLEYIRARQK